MKIGIIREGKSPNDKRVAFTPDQCIFIQESFKEVEILVQPSECRCYKDEEYSSKGVMLQEDLSSCDILLGIKEVPPQDLISNKKYLFFSHTLKKQAKNKKLLQTLLEKNIEMIDYECLTDQKSRRVIGFGYYAGLVGTYNAVLGYGKRFKMFDLKPAHLCKDVAEIKEELKNVHLPNIKIAVTGNGRVANGAIELLGYLGVRRVTPYEFTHYAFMKATYTQLHSKDFNIKKDASAWDTDEFHQHPENFESIFNEYTEECDILINASYWNPLAPQLFTKEEMKSPKYRIGVIADIACDVDGGIPATKKSTTIDDKFFGYNPNTEAIEEPFKNETITVMAVDNLPCELPRDASEDFGKNLIEKVLPALLTEDKEGMIERACITKDKKLQPNFRYLSDFVK